jgi:ribosome-binding protein aMBF1 (putative translation factor)
MTITGPQVKAARALLGWSRERLAGEADLHTRTILNFEGGKGRPMARIVSVIQLALEEAGVEFVEGESSVRLKAKP